MAQSEEEKSAFECYPQERSDALLIIDGRGAIILSSSSAKDFFGDAPCKACSSSMW